MNSPVWTRGPWLLLAIAATAVGFAAADTYVVVLALPDMMTASGVAVDELARGAPIVSGFLLGYVAILPVIGRLSDLRGRVPVLIGSLIIFSIGSLITAAGYSLESIVFGRFIQGVGAGGLIAPTLALVADLWTPERRGLPLGVVGAVQELGSVLGPLFGAMVLAFGTWRDIFWLSAAGGGLLMTALLAAREKVRDTTIATQSGQRQRTGRFDWLGLALVTIAASSALLVMLEPERLATGVTSGLAFLPLTGQSRWLSPLALAAVAVLLAAIVRIALARRPLLDWRSWRRLAAQTDVLGAGFMTLGLSAIIVAFASAEPESATISGHTLWLLPLALVAFVALWWRQKVAAHPLIPRGSLVQRPAVGALVVSFFVGAALIAAIVDIPFFARLTIHPDSQLDAALVLVRFLVAIPLGALLGGWLQRHFNQPGWITCGAMLLSAAAFARMATWSSDALLHWGESITLVAAGLGFGLAIAPVNAALMAYTPPPAHGVASALLIVARMVGMLVGISVLTTFGVRAFRSAAARIGPAEDICGGTAQLCDAYRDALQAAGLTQLHVVFAGAAALCVLAAVSAAFVHSGAALRRAKVEQ